MMALLLASAVAVSSCGSKERISLAIPPAADLRTEDEPRYPPAALEDTPEGELAERAFNNEVLSWGRTLKLQVDRLCRWFKRSGAQLDCPPAP